MIPPEYSINRMRFDPHKRYIQKLEGTVSQERQIFYLGTNEKDGNTRCFFTAEMHINTDDATVNDIEYLLFVEKVGFNGNAGYLRFHFVFDKKDGKRVYQNHWHIDDFAITSDLRDRGYGTLMLQSFMDYAKSCEVKIVTGTLSFVDELNFDRSKHLYKKMGFDVDCKNLRCDLSNFAN